MLIEIKNDIQEVARVCDQVELFCAENAVSTSKQHDIALILDELITNVICYAYPNDIEHIFTLNIWVKGPMIHIKLADDGREFNPLNKEDPDTASPLEERKIGGLGIFLVKRLSKSIKYSRVDGKNQLELEVSMEDGEDNGSKDNN
ncbi:MAG: ATP-binding protein [Holosporaceae bacterium]|jgi:anti-sigma regulatory factor (Ser/Thr protein kinase)|nr:ATP-binding protein [Holosporaceae bacterium]